MRDFAVLIGVQDAKFVFAWLAIMFLGGGASALFAAWLAGLF